MCHFQDSNHCKKSPLNGVDFLYDNDADSDVVFLVGVEPDVWRIPGHRKILSNANLVFRALMEGPLATCENTIIVEDVEGRAFDYLLRYLYGKKIDFQSSSTVLSTLYAAHKYLCTGLIELCVKYLNENLNTKNVLKIYSHARLYALGDIEKEFEPSAPEAPTENCDLYKPTLCYPSMMNDQGGSCRKSDGDDKSLQTNSIPFWSNALIYNCLQHIDENADEVLSQEGIEDLNAENLKEIIKRDTLKIKSEYVVFLALDRWSNRECMRQQLNLNPENRRFVLKDLIYEIRFPFFFPDEFLMGPIQGGWLDQQELAVFSAMISNVKSKEQVPHWWKPHLDKILRKRIYTKHESVNLRQRTYTIESAKWQEKDFKKNLIFKKIKKKNKSAAKERNSISFSENKERSCAGCFRDFLVDVLISIFD